jgi:hypothetical protein
VWYNLEHGEPQRPTSLFTLVNWSWNFSFIRTKVTFFSPVIERLRSSLVVQTNCDVGQPRLYTEWLGLTSVQHDLIVKFCTIFFLMLLTTSDNGGVPAVWKHQSKVWNIHGWRLKHQFDPLARWCKKFSSIKCQYTFWFLRVNMIFEGLMENWVTTGEN